MDDLTQLGVGGIFALMVIKEGFSFAKALMTARKNGNGGSKANGQVDWHQLQHQIDQLHTMHDVRDADGMPMWYVPRSLSGAVDKLADAIEEDAKVSAESIRTLDRINSNVKEVRRDINDLTKKVDAK